MEPWCECGHFMNVHKRATGILTHCRLCNCKQFTVPENVEKK